MPKDNVSLKLMFHIIKAQRIAFHEKYYDQWVEILDPDGDIGLEEAELSYEELMWLKDEVNKK